MAAFVESHFADAAFTQLDQAAMAAGKTLQGSAFELLGQLGRTLDGHRIENGREWR